eukprot:6821066-Alexandrium_andersonii.AAC.1
MKAQEGPTQQRPDSDDMGINAGQARIAQGHNKSTWGPRRCAIMTERGLSSDSAKSGPNQSC